MQSCYKILSISLFSFICINASSQDTLERFIKQKCDHVVQCGKELNEIKIKMIAPCFWDSVNDEMQGGVAPLREFLYKVKDNNFISGGLIMLKFPAGVSKKEKDSIFSDLPHNDIFAGKYISHRNVTIGLKKWLEVTTASVIEIPQGKVYQVLLYYTIIYKDCIVILLYKAFSFEGADETAALFDEYKRVLSTLASGTVLYEKK